MKQVPTTGRIPHWSSGERMIILSAETPRDDEGTIETLCSHIAISQRVGDWTQTLRKSPPGIVTEYGLADRMVMISDPCDPEGGFTSRNYKAFSATFDFEDIEVEIIHYVFRGGMEKFYITGYVVDGDDRCRVKIRWNGANARWEPFIGWKGTEEWESTVTVLKRLLT